MDLAGGRTVYLGPRYVAPTVIYSDASYSSRNGCKLGIVIMSPRLRKPLGLVSVIPDAAWKTFGNKATYITQGEAFVCLLGPYHAPAAFVDTDVIWFLDNVGAEACFTSGYSADTSLAAIVSVMRIVLASLNCRVWWEHVSSECNPSDGLSRDGITDLWSRQQDWDLKQVPCPSWDGVNDTPLITLLRTHANRAAGIRTHFQGHPSTSASSKNQW